MYAEANRQIVYDFDILTLLYRTKDLLENIDLSLKNLNVNYSNVPTSMNFQTVSQEVLNENMYKVFDIQKLISSQLTPTLADLFRNNTKVNELILSNWNVSGVIVMNYMFGNDVIIPKIPYETSQPSIFPHLQPYVHNSSISSINLANWNTSSVEYMSYMFAGCTSLQSIDIQSFDMSKVIDVTGMFAYCSILKNVLLPSNMLLDSVASIANMFYDCYTLNDIDISDLSTNNIANMSKVFCNCSSLKYVSLPKNIKDGIILTGLFFFCLSLESINMVGCFPSTATLPYNMTAMFYGCKSLRYINFSDCTLPTGTKTLNMFLNTPSLTTINVTNCNYTTIDILQKALVSNGHTANLVTNDESNAEKALIQVGLAINIIEPENLDISTATQSELDSIPYYRIRTINQMNKRDKLFSGNLGITNLILTNLYTRNIISLESEFEGCTNLLVLDLSGWNTFRVESTKSMFKDCTQLFKIEPFTSGLALNNSPDLGDTQQLKDMSNMFQNCIALTRLNLDMFDTSRVKNMDHLFDGCISLLQVSLSGWITSNVISFNSMFNDCEGLTTLDLSNWDVSNVQDLSNMFAGCSSLQTLKLSNWNIMNVQSMSNMFMDCASLQTLDLSNWNTSDINKFDGLFNGCILLRTLDLSGWNLLNATSFADIFTQCISLQSITIAGCSTFTILKLIESLDDNFNFTKIGDVINVTSGIDIINFHTITQRQLENANYMSFDFQSSVLANKALYASMFSENNNISSLYLSGWFTTGITSLANMFNGCTNLKFVSLSNWDVSNVTNFSSLFNNCTSLKTIELYGWQFKNNGLFVDSRINTSNMFTNTPELRTVTTSLAANGTPMHYQYLLSIIEQYHNPISTSFTEDVVTISITNS